MVRRKSYFSSSKLFLGQKSFLLSSRASQISFSPRWDGLLFLIHARRSLVFPLRQAQKMMFSSFSFPGKCLPYPPTPFFLQHSPPLSQHLPTSRASSGGRKEGRRRESSVADEKGDDEMRDGQGTHTHRVLPPFSHGDAQKAAAAEALFL